MAGSATASASATTKTLQRLQAHGFDPRPNGAILSHFSHLVLLSSDQDAYAPSSSCRAEWCDAALTDDRNGPAYGEMLRGFFEGVPCERVCRWGVHFKDLSSILAGRISLDGMLGREAHVAFLETEELAALVAVGLEPVWE